MRHMLSLAAAAALAVVPAYGQRPPVQNRTEIPAPNEGQAAGRNAVRPIEGQAAGRNAVRPIEGQTGAGQVGNRPVAGRSVPANQVGRVGAQPAAGGVGNAVTIGRAQATGVNDALFAAAAADSGLAEVTLSQLGLQRATDSQLKEFSRKMVEEHTRLNQELMTLAARKGMRVPQMLDIRSQFCAQSLAGLSGDKFDECYARAQLVAHMDALAMFEAESQRGVDPDVKAMAAKAVPHIKEHLDQLKPIAEKCTKEEGSAAGGSGNSRIGAPGGRPIR